MDAGPQLVALPGGAQNSQPFYLTVAGESVFAVFHPATGGHRPVLFCPPFGWDEACSHRSVRDWAGRLSAAGHPALRLDLPGCGDSTGGPYSPALVEAWVAALSTAAAWLADSTGHRTVDAIGLGIGGLLALSAAGRGAPLTALVLWGTQARGRTAVRELTATAALERDGSSGDDALHGAPDGALEVGGHVLSAETLASLSVLEPESAGSVRRVLLLDRDGLPADARLADRLRSQPGVEVDLEAGPGWGEMMTTPQEARPPLDVFERVGAWLRDAGQEGEPVAGHALRPAAPPAPLTPGGEPPTLPAAVLRWGDSTVREAPLSLPRAFGRLAGVLSLPEAGPAAPVCALLLNSGALRRIGPNRMWVEIARDLAGHGVAALRLDVEGLGDADGDAREYFDRAAYNVPELVEQVCGAMDELGARGLPDRFALVGLCSGAFQAFQAALAHPGATGACLLNPGHLFWEESRAAAREAKPVSRVLSPTTLRKLARGAISPRRVLELAGAQTTALRLRPPKREVADAFDRLGDQDKRLLIAFSGDEPLRRELDRQGLTAQRERWPHVAFAELPGAVHTLRPLLAQRTARSLVVDFVAGECRRALTATQAQAADDAQQAPGA